MSAWYPALGQRSHKTALRLFCYPHAGGGPTAFRAWPDELPAHVEVRAAALPGHPHRFSELCSTDLPALVRALAAELEPLFELPFALFGHSFGALLAFEVARELRRLGAPPPVCLFVAARRAPDSTRGELRRQSMSDDQLLAEVELWGGIPTQIRREPELLHRFMPVLRADLALDDTYHYLPEPPLGSPISAFSGTSDPLVPEAALRAWKTHTATDFTLARFAGGHFFPHESRIDILRQVAADLGRLW